MATAKRASAKKGKSHKSAKRASAKKPKHPKGSKEKKPLNAYAQLVKDNFHKIKKLHPTWSFGQIQTHIRSMYKK